MNPITKTPAPTRDELNLTQVLRTVQAPTVFIKLSGVQQRTAMSKSAIYRDIAAGTFPKPIQLGKRAVAWLESDVVAWMNARIAESTEGA